MKNLVPAARANRLATAALLIVLSLVLIIGSQTALAADPPTSPATIRSTLGFEGTPWPPSDLGLQPISWSVPPATAYWGRIADRRLNGAYGLWCAGSLPSAWSIYPEITRGRATLSLPQLENYYSASVSLYYSMPSYGVEDANSLGVLWWDADNTRDSEFHSGFAKTAVGAWNQITYDITGANNQSNLSRDDARVAFQFYDFGEGYGQSPTTGEGATIDDVTVVGYKYGPVRTLTSSQLGTSVLLEWSKPARATGATADDERTVAYRVWRAPQTTGPFTWTELTTGRITDTTYTDSTVTAEEDYTYLVQAWDTASGTGYGPITTKQVYVTVAPPVITLTASANPSSAMVGQSITYTYQVYNASASPVTSLQVVDSFGTAGSTATLASGATYTTTRVTSYGATGTYNNNVTASATSLGEPVNDAKQVTVQVANPSVRLTVSAASPVERGSNASFSYTVKNTGLFTITGAQVTDAILSGPISVGTLAPGAQATHVRSVAANAPIVSNGHVTASANGTPVSDDAATKVVSIWERIKGDSRILTAIQASKRAFPSAGSVDNAVIATAWDWPDALAAAGLVGAADGPLLLVDQNDVPGSVINELNRLGVSKVYIIGGPGTLGQGVWNDLSAFSRERLGGNNRYDTARLVAKEVRSLTGTVDTVFVATGSNFPDALAASSAAAAMDAPILLTATSALPPETKSALTLLDPDTAVICGSTGAVSSSVQTALAPYATSVIRRSGGNRYATARSILQWAQTSLAPSGPTGIYLATGDNFPDALAGGALAANADGVWRPLMLTAPSALSPEAASYIQANGTMRHVGVLGGTGSVSDKVLNSAKGYLP